jgi:polysaccharide deacetylase 2 family uncharacterized protein YibQ
MAMLRLKPIRPARPQGPSRQQLRIADGAFWIVLVFAAAFGAQGVASGFPKLLGWFVPPGMIAAEAGISNPVHVVRVPLSPSLADLGVPQIRATADSDDLIGPPPPPVGVPAIAFVIDDLGADPHTPEAIALPREVALAFLPYPADTPRLAREAKRAGHEILAHVPMEALGAHNPGPYALTVGLSPDEIARRLDWALSRVPGYMGINNHEGSRFTAYRAGLEPVMQDLARRNAVFFDSRTTPDSLILPVARSFGVASAARDVFLDDVETIDAVDAQLRALEARARQQGAAIAIGHPHEITLDAVRYWIAHRGGFELISLGEAIRRKSDGEARRSLALSGR